MTLTLIELQCVKFSIFQDSETSTLNIRDVLTRQRKRSKIDPIEVPLSILVRHQNTSIN